LGSLKHSSYLQYSSANVDLRDETMKAATNKTIRLTTIIVLFFLALQATAESVPNARFKTFVENLRSSSVPSHLKDIHQYKMLYGFYEKNNFSIMWFSKNSDADKRTSLQHLISNADLFALEPSSFHYSLLTQKNYLANAEDSFTAEVAYTDAALSFMHDLAYGGDNKFVQYNGLAYHPDHLDLITTLNEAFKAPSFITKLTMVEPNGGKFACLKEEYLKLLVTYKQPGFKEIKVTDKDIKISNVNLTNKLIQLGYLTNSDTSLQSLQAALKKFQQRHKLLVQNSINSYCLEVLNEPIKERLEELIWNIRWHRWLNGMKDKSYVVVNIPSNRLIYYDKGSPTLESRIVVGKLSTPTPTLTSMIKYVVYYPYWNVPSSIAIKEMLPALKRNPSYIYRERLEVLRDERVVSRNINWSAYSASNFPFQLRQKPGCNNALGRLKFEFDNPFHVYLHDTNFKIAFAASKRFFSHGCMRIEKPFDLAVALGVPPEKIDMTECLENMKPHIIPLPQPVPVFVIYATIDVIEGEIEWYEDAYRKIIKDRD
jgi:L,D-transpeptidase YcbB